MQLRRWGHVLFLLGTVGSSVATALVLAVLRPETDMVAAVLSGAVVMLAGGLGYEILVRRAGQAREAERLSRLRQGYEDLLDLLQRRLDDGSKAAAASASPIAEPAPATAATAVVQPAPVSPSAALPVPQRVGSPASKTFADETDMAAIVRAALAEQRIEFYLQPIVSLSQRKHRFYEVLSRIRLPDGQMLLPDQYLAAAQCERLLPAIDLLLLKRIAQLVRETDRRQHAVGFFANISPVTLLDAGFTAQFIRGTDHQPLRTKLMFEINQYDLAAGVPAVLTMLDDLKRQGYRFSLGQVERFAMDIDALVAKEVHFIKLNAATLTDVGLRSQVIGLQAQLTGRPIELIAEKIETEQQLACAVGLGIGYGQGFLIGEPRASRRMP